ncbi:sepiapterin reductase [Anoplophora glabripennis]|nr:sepiapterin reductase [Anoplophora glabripennis]
MACSVNFSKKSIIFITGASKGIGRTIAVELSRHLDQNSVFILIARSEKGLDETKTQILMVDKSITVQTYVLDLSKPDINDYNKLFQNILSSVDTSGIEFGLIFHNAGHVGTLKQTADLTDLTTWHEYYDLNLFSAVLLNSVFVKQIRPIAPQLVVVNITSLCGRSPTLNLSMYGSGKAARELFFKVLALEEPKIIVLNYSPGPVETDMFETIITDAQSEVLKKSFREVKESTVLTTEQTVSKLLDILEKGDFKTGDTIDYYDRN